MGLVVVVVWVAAVVVAVVAETSTLGRIVMRTSLPDLVDADSVPIW